jgi:hypothetical protein
MHRIALRNSARAKALVAPSRVCSPLFSLFFSLTSSRLVLYLLSPECHSNISSLLRYCKSRYEHVLASSPAFSFSLSLLFSIPPFLARHVISSTAASEVSSILESRISGTAVGGNVEETGRVLSTFFFPFFTSFRRVRACFLTVPNRRR